MKLGTVCILVMVISASAAARASVSDGAPIVDRSSRSDPGETGAPDAPSGSPAGEAAAVTLPDLIPLGPPTGARDELAVKPSGPVSAVPEPATLAVFGVGLLLLFRRRSAA